MEQARRNRENGGVRLIQNWRETALKAWSVRFALAAVVIEVAAVLPTLGDYVPNGVGAFFAVAAAVARVIQQQNLPHD